MNLSDNATLLFFYVILGVIAVVGTLGITVHSVLKDRTATRVALG